MLDSAPFPVAGLLTRRLVEVELHHCDLASGYSAADWPAAFATMDLPEPMRSQRQDRLSYPPLPPGLPLRAGDCAPKAVRGSIDRRHVNPDAGSEVEVPGVVVIAIPGSQPEAAEPAGEAASAQHLRARLAAVETRVQLAVDARSGGAPPGEAADHLRGLYLRTGDILGLLAAGPPSPVRLDDNGEQYVARVEAEVDAAEAEGRTTRLRSLQRAFGLDNVAVDLLLVAVAPDLDPRFERFYGFLHDDVSRRRPSIGLALALAGQPLQSGASRRRFSPASPLVGGGLLGFENQDRPFLTRALLVPDRVTGHLVGDDTPDEDVEPLLAPVVLTEVGDAAALARGIASGSRLCYVQQRRGAFGQEFAAMALAQLGLAAVQLDLHRLPAGPVRTDTARAAGREALLRAGALIAGPVEALADRGPDAVRAFAELPCCTILVGGRSWDPLWARQVPLQVAAPVPTRQQRSELWKRAADGLTDGVEPDGATLDFRLTPPQVLGALAAAGQSARAEARPVTPMDLRSGARAQNAAGLERLARRIEPTITWRDLVLPPMVISDLQELVHRYRHQDTVYETWGMGGISSRRRGTIALFSGPPGTGKTMASEVVAGEFGFDLYVINLATVVDKYIGETEKNLERVFAEAEEVNGVLFFDEADAIFGKRSEVRDARDRYANIEIAYLLQRMELFDGIAILATNLKSNVDAAFARRLDASVDFPSPDKDARRRLWETCIGPTAPREPDIDLDFLANSFELAGGSIRNIAVGAAFAAARRDAPISMADLIVATGQEYRKLGRLCAPSEFGLWKELVERP